MFRRVNMENDLLVVLKSQVHRVNLDVEPYIPAGCSIKEHLKGGIVNIERITHYSSKKLRLLTEVLTEVDGKRLANASFLDYLVCNKGLIADNWKGLNLIFAGTIYRNFKGELFVRSLFWDVSWEWNFVPLSAVFSKNCVIVLLG